MGWFSRRRPQQQRTLDHPGEYRGQARIELASSVGRSDLSESEWRSNRQAWLGFLQEPHPELTELEIGFQTGQPYLDALVAQPQLRSLSLSWGRYHDLSPLTGMPGLAALSLGGASQLADLSTLASMPSLRDLALEDCFRVTDFAPLAALTGLTRLGIGTGLGTDRTLTIPSLRFLLPLTALEQLWFAGTRIGDGDYLPIAALRGLRRLGLPIRRDLRGQYEQLRAALPELDPTSDFITMAAVYRGDESLTSFLARRRIVRR